MHHMSPEPRVPVDLPVRVWGMTADGRPFNQQARAKNISSAGAMIGGVDNDLRIGDVIGMQFADKKTRCTVVWMHQGATRKNEVGVKVLANQECPWKRHLPSSGSDLTTRSPFVRRFARHKISYPMDVRTEYGSAPRRLHATDISGSGCYIETLSPLPVQASVRLDFDMQSEHVSTVAIVRTCDPGVGNGIEFTGLPLLSKQRVQRYLDGIDPHLGVARS